MEDVRDAIMNALGLIETLLAMRDDVPAELIDGAELVKQQLTAAVETLDELQGDRG